MPRQRVLKFRADDGDAQAIQDAIAVRRSGFFSVDGVLLLPEGESDQKTACLAEICRYFLQTIHRREQPSGRSAETPLRAD